MAVTNDELALRAALEDVTLDQPDMPVDRAGAVRRRYVRRRQIQAVAAAAAVAVIAAGAVVVGGGLRGNGTTQPLNRDVPSWALPWADHRDGSVPQRVLTGAVSSWADKQREAAPLPAGQSIDMQPAVWFVGEAVQGTDQVLAVFEANGLHAGSLPLTKGPRLVVAQAAWNDVKYSTEKGSKAWTFIDVAAPPHDFGGFIGGYVPVPAGDDGIHNVMWLLTSPRARSVSWEAEMPGRHRLSGLTALEKGFGTMDTGQLMSRVRITALATGPEGQSVPAAGYLGVPGVSSSQVPTLAPAGPVTGVPQGPLTLGESSGQGSSTYVDGDARAPAGRATTVYARCYSAGGSRSILVSMDANTDRARAHGVRIPCDNRQHVVPGNPTRPSLYGGGHAVSVEADELVDWVVAVVIHSH